jgi:hypothetical protein
LHLVVRFAGWPLVATNRRRVPVVWSTFLVFLQSVVWGRKSNFDFLILSLVPSLVAGIVAGGFQCCPILCCE